MLVGRRWGPVGGVRRWSASLKNAEPKPQQAEGAKRAFLHNDPQNERTEMVVNVTKNYRPRPTIYNATRAWTTKDAADFEVYRLPKDT